MHVADHELLSRYLDEHSAALVLFARQFCDVPEDVVQEAFIQLMQQRPVPNNVVGWLYRVVRNGAIKALRAQTRRVRHEQAAADCRESWFKPSIERELDAATVTAALERLPVDDRELFVLRVWCGRSFEEIAELIGKSTSTAHRRFEAALATLRRACMQEQGVDDE